MHTRLKNKLTAILIILSFFIMAAVSVSAIFALTQQNVETEVDFDYQAPTLDALTFTVNSYADNVVISKCDNTKLASTNGELIIPSTYEDKPIVSVSDSAFKSCTNLKSIIFKEGITSIGARAFSSCNALTSVVLPNTLKTIGEEAFWSCSKLTSLEIPKSVTSLGAGSFSLCGYLKNLTVEEGNEKYYSINNCVIEKSTKTLIECINVQNIPTDGSVLVLGKWSLAYHYEDTITIPDSVTTIKTQAFYGSWLKKISIPANLVSMEGNPFSACTKVTQITCNANNKVYKSVNNCLIEISSKTVVVGCKNSVIPTDSASVVRIGDDAFNNCDEMTSVVIPSNITMIGKYAFSYSDKLTSVTFVTTSNWFIASSESATSGTTLSSADLSNTSTAATYLTTTYINKYWKRV